MSPPTDQKVLGMPVSYHTPSSPFTRGCAKIPAPATSLPSIVDLPSVAIDFTNGSIETTPAST
ncbi:uncharacterized protein ColSpa_07408 [Colletotrichum spaethianum]|uniref:Uncharacterized protein n=1 Tax=Colletotrichum spaethianum TaxID=700344 RepID=A0AA37NZE3_9PEZI|nr:uncharacterized protein ColSpa_07408 [Colletotrichum spaethianum]GKT47227.1 hypothetical protein ColSpa_07408 [Colletotrichum spaethianum]